MAKSKAKWLAESTTRELVVLMKECIKEEDSKKANKIISELLERIPEEDDTQSIEEMVEKAKKDLDAILEVYNQEAAAVVVAEDDDEEEEEKKPAKKRRSKKSAKPQEEPEEDDEDEDEDDEEEDDEDEDEDEDDGYEDMTQGELKKELRRRGIKVTKSMKKADMIRALEADDEE